MAEHAHSVDRGSRWLSRAALIFVALAAVMGWAASFVGLQDYGLHKMNGFTPVTAWFIPGAFDGAAFGTSLITYRASINGRSALRGRVLMWAFTAVSSGINYIHQPDHTAQLVAAGLPMAAVAVFDIVLLELRADYEARHGKRGFRLRPGLLVLRWLVDRTGTKTAFRGQVMAIPVEEIAGLGNPLLPMPTPRPERIGPLPAPQVASEGSEPVSATDAPAPSAVPVSGALEHAESEDEPTGRISVNNPAEPLERADAVSSEGTPANNGSHDAGQLDATSQQIPVAALTRSDNGASPVSDAPVTDADKRAAARRDYLASLERHKPVTGAQLGARYGFSARWGREQIKAARQVAQHEQHSELVSAARSA